LMALVLLVVVFLGMDYLQKKSFSRKVWFESPSQFAILSKGKYPIP
jgi:hypothetical protein